MQDLHDLGLMLDRNTPLLLIESHEEARVLELLTRIAVKRGLALQQWTVSDGLRRLGFGEEVSGDETFQPVDALKRIKARDQGGLFVLCDLHPYLEDPLTVRLIKDIALQHERLGKTLVLLSHRIDAPAEVQRLSMRFDLQLPDEGQLLSLVKEEAQRYAKHSGRKVKTDSATLQQIVSNLRGLTFSDAQRLVRGAIVDDGALTQDDVPEVSKAKMALLDMEGVMSFEYDTARFGDVAGLENMKTWLEARRSAFLQSGDSMRPRGMMLFGVQGSGKSLAAKAVAGSWGVPLLRLDFGALYNKFFGETERNLRESLKLAETMSPCVVWMDEVEKGLGQDSNDAGVSQRLLGTLLTWMAEHQEQVFVVATANNIHALPPELMRKGRLDELFFVDLPGVAVREAILRLHMEKRGLDTERFDLTLLAQISDGFSGAELEQVVVSAWHSVRSLGDHEVINTEMLMTEIQRTQPLSVTMAEQLGSLRQWAQGRAVMAD
ncbi:AAA family ATPase [Bacterioplanoides sp.]|uniref:AAA family ATPase n=1 Tax=Bacterioplanoides sp. TaxID=2066072 RepID=UPI003AFFE9F6